MLDWKEVGMKLAGIETFDSKKKKRQHKNKKKKKKIKNFFFFFYKVNDMMINTKYTGGYTDSH